MSKQLKDLQLDLAIFNEGEVDPCRCELIFISKGTPVSVGVESSSFSGAFLSALDRLEEVL